MLCLSLMGEERGRGSSRGLAPHYLAVPRGNLHTPQTLPYLPVTPEPEASCSAGGTNASPVQPMAPSSLVSHVTRVGLGQECLPCSVS